MRLIAKVVVYYRQRTADDHKGVLIYLPDEAFYLADLRGMGRMEDILLLTAEAALPSIVVTPGGYL